MIGDVCCPTMQGADVIGRIVPPDRVVLHCGADEQYLGIYSVAKMTHISTNPFGTNNQGRRTRNSPVSSLPRQYPGGTSILVASDVKVILYLFQK